MKVCILSSVHSCFDARIFHKEARSLVKAGYQVTLVAIADFAETVVDQIRILGLRKPKTRLLRPLNWYRILRIALRERADVYHFHDPELLPLGWFLHKITGKPVIYDCHEHYAELILVKEWIPFPFRRLLSNMVATIEPRIAASLSAVVGVMDTQLPIFSNLVILYNFPVRSLFESPGHGTRDPRRLIYVGELSKERGVLLMLEVMSLLRERDVQLVLVGPFYSSDTEADVQTSIIARGLAQRVQLTGVVPHNQLHNYLMRATVGLIPVQPVSQFDRIIPTKMFEYMACALPIVASDLPPIRRFTGDLGCGFLVEPEDPQSYARAIDYLLDHPEEARKMGENGRAAFLEKYNWEANEEGKLLSLYDSLLGTASHLA